ncbi:hypothetical protein ES707_00543 [subsurface metagenome]|jgi:hypothetical protein
MRTLMVFAALLGMMASLHAKEADLSRAVQSTEAAGKQFVGNQGSQPRAKPARTRSDGRKEREFSAEVIVPDICTGC